MSELLDLLKSDLHKAMKREVEMRRSDTASGTMYEACMAVKDVARSVISMFPELGIKPDKASDDDTIYLLKKYVTIEKTRELYLQKILTEPMVSGLSSKELSTLTKVKIAEMGNDLTSMKISIAQTYLPKEVGIIEIKEWVEKNIDFSSYKNKMQAMKPIMEHFKGADGNIVKQIIMEI